MQKLRLLIALFFVAITMTLGACAEDESLNEIENNLETTGDGGDGDDRDGGMGESNDGDESDGGM